MSDVFISYSRENSNFAKKLNEHLAIANKDAWVDWEDIPLTSDWWDEIKEGIDKADNFIFIISPDSMKSFVCNLEVNHAIAIGKRIIPVVYQDVEPEKAIASIAVFAPDESLKELLEGQDQLEIIRDNWQRLSHINWTFFRELDDFDTAFDSLIAIVDTDLEYVKAHTRYLTRAQEWGRNDKRSDLLLFGEEIDRAEQWLVKANNYATKHSSDKEDVVNPLAQDIQREYIAISRKEDKRRKRLARSAQLSIAVLAVVLILGIGTLFTVNAEVNVASTTIAKSEINLSILGQFADPLIINAENSNLLEEAEALVRTYPDEAISYYIRGIVFDLQGDTASALINYNYAIELDPQYADAYNNRGKLTYYNRFIEDSNNLALADFNMAIESNPRHALAYYNRGVLFFNRREVNDAINDFTSAIELNASFADAYATRAVAYFNRSRFEHPEDLQLALSDASRAIELDFALIEVFLLRGTIHYYMGDYNESLSDFAIYEDSVGELPYDARELQTEAQRIVDESE